MDLELLRQIRDVHARYIHTAPMLITQHNPSQCPKVCRICRNTAELQKAILGEFGRDLIALKKLF